MLNEPRSEPRKTLAWLLALGLFVPACGGGSEPAATSSGDAEATESADKPAADAPPEKKMPEYEPSGVKDAWKKWNALRGDARNSRGEARATAQQALADYEKATAEEWLAKSVPAPETIYLAPILAAAGKHFEAVTQIERYLEVAPESGNNYKHATYYRITSLVASGQLDEAQKAIEEAAAGVLEMKTDYVKGGYVALADALTAKKEFEKAAAIWEKVLPLQGGDQNAAIFGTDCWQLAGNPAKAKELAKTALEGFEAGGNDRAAKRMRQLKMACDFVGADAPGFPGTIAWKGAGSEITQSDFMGKVTVVFGWNMNMKPKRTEGLFKGMAQLETDYGTRGVNIVGISRLARFDPSQGGTRKEMSDDEELGFYNQWASVYNVHYPLAVGGYEDDTLVNAWNAHAVPSVIVVGKNAKIAYTRTGADPEHFEAIRMVIDRELAR